MGNKNKRSKTPSNRELTSKQLASYLDGVGWSKRTITRGPDGSIRVETAWASRRHPDGFELSIVATSDPPRVSFRVRNVVTAAWHSTSQLGQRQLHAYLNAENYKLFGMKWACDLRDGEVVLDLDHEGPLPAETFEKMLRGLVRRVEQTQPILRRILDAGADETREVAVA
jgi:hypothetical protein